MPFTRNLTPLLSQGRINSDSIGARRKSRLTKTDYPVTLKLREVIERAEPEGRQNTLNQRCQSMRKHSR